MSDRNTAHTFELKHKDVCGRRVTRDKIKLDGESSDKPKTLLAAVITTLDFSINSALLYHFKTRLRGQDRSKRMVNRHACSHKRQSGGSQSLTADWNQFPCCCCSVRVKPSKESTVWVTPSNLPVGRTTGSWYDYWRVISAGLQASVHLCVNVWSTHLLLLFCPEPLTRRSKFISRRFIFLRVFVYCSGVVSQSQR